MSESSLGFGRLSRRTALKGLGCTLGLPLLEAMLPGTGYAAGTGTVSGSATTGAALDPTFDTPSEYSNLTTLSNTFKDELKLSEKTGLPPVVLPVIKTSDKVCENVPEEPVAPSAPFAPVAPTTGI